MRADETRPLLAPPPPTALAATEAGAAAARQPLSLRERRLKNLQKRVKLRSKRLRAHWAAIAAFLDLRSCVALASTCRRFAPLLQDARVWQREYASAQEQPLTKLLRSEPAAAAHEPPVAAKQKLQRLVHARRVLDPTNSLQRRLREAERDLHEAATRQRKVREVCRLNIAVAVVLCGLSAWSFLVERGDALAATPLDRRERTKHQGDPMKTFLVALDVLSLVTVLLLSFGSSTLSANGLGTAALLGFLQFAVMAFTLLTRTSPDQILHAATVLLALAFNVVLAKRKQRECEDEVAAFVGKY